MSSFLSTRDYLALPRSAHKWVIRDLVVAGGLTNIYGKPKAGKSFTALGMAIAVSSGQSEWLGFEVFEHGPVAILEVDTPRSEWADRLVEIEKQGYNTSNLYHCDSQMTKVYPVELLDPMQVEWLRQEMDQLKPVMVIVDTLREVHSGDENESRVMRNLITNLVSACRPAALVLLSHSRKPSAFDSAGGDDLMMDNRGSSYVSGKMDVVIKMTGNGKHATGLRYQGRSAGADSIDVTQEPGTGLVILDGASAEYHALVARKIQELRAADPKTSVNAIAEAVAESTTYRKINTISKDVKAALERLGAPVRIRRKSRSLV